MSNDSEHAAIGRIIQALHPLDDQQRRSVIAYFVERFQVGRNGDATQHSSGRTDVRKQRTTQGRRKAARARPQLDSETGVLAPKVDIARLVNHFKQLDNFEEIEQAILDKTDLLNRVLLVLAMHREVVGNEDGLTSGDIVKFYSQLNIKIGQPNVSTMLSDRAKQYVMTDAVRVKGAIMRYRLSRPGIKKVTELGLLGAAP
jgi:hypothetical protein